MVDNWGGVHVYIYIYLEYPLYVVFLVVAWVGLISSRLAKKRTCMIKKKDVSDSCIFKGSQSVLNALRKRLRTKTTQKASKRIQGSHT